MFVFLKCIRVLLVCVCIISFVTFNAFIGFCVFFCIYEHILKMFLNLFRKMSQKCEQCSYEIFFVILVDFGSKWSQPHPRRQCQSSLQGETYGNTCFLLFFKMCMNNSEKCTKMITSCSIRRVGLMNESNLWSNQCVNWMNKLSPHRETLNKHIGET